MPISGHLTEDKGLYSVVRAIQMLKTANRGAPVLVGLAGPSGAGKTEFSRRLASIIPLIHIRHRARPIPWSVREVRTSLVSTFITFTNFWWSTRTIGPMYARGGRTFCEETVRITKDRQDRFAGVAMDSMASFSPLAGSHGRWRM